MSIYFYTTSGTAQDFADRIADEGKQYGLHTNCINVENYDTVCTQSLKRPDTQEHFSSQYNEIIVFCAATYGEGEPAENAIVYHDWLMAEDRPEDLLKDSTFAVCFFSPPFHQLIVTDLWIGRQNL